MTVLTTGKLARERPGWLPPGREQVGLMQKAWGPRWGAVLAKLPIGDMVELLAAAGAARGALVEAWNEGLAEIDRRRAEVRADLLKQDRVERKKAR